MPQKRIYEHDTDTIFIQCLRSSPQFAAAFAEAAAGRRLAIIPEVEGQVPHAGGGGCIDIWIAFPDGLLLLVENEIGACRSTAQRRLDEGKRYRRSIRFYGMDVEPLSVLLAPNGYLTASRLAEVFDSQVAYEDLLPYMEKPNRDVVLAAIEQAHSPYDPTSSAGAGEFFSAVSDIMRSRFPGHRPEEGARRFRRGFDAETDGPLRCRRDAATARRHA